MDSSLQTERVVGTFFLPDVQGSSIPEVFLVHLRTDRKFILLLELVAC